MVYNPVEQLPWMDESSCAGIGGDIWFPDQNAPRARAIRVCESCPVKRQCLEYAVTNHETQGIWGGLYGRQLRRLQGMAY